MRPVRLGLPPRLRNAYAWSKQLGAVHFTYRVKKYRTVEVRATTPFWDKSTMANTVLINTVVVAVGCPGQTVSSAWPWTSATTCTRSPMRAARCSRATSGTPRWPSRLGGRVTIAALGPVWPGVTHHRGGVLVLVPPTKTPQRRGFGGQIKDLRAQGNTVLHPVAPMDLDMKKPRRLSIYRASVLGRLMGLEPTTTGITIQCSNQLNYSRRWTGQIILYGAGEPVGTFGALRSPKGQAGIPGGKGSS